MLCHDSWQIDRSVTLLSICNSRNSYCFKYSLHEVMYSSQRSVIDSAVKQWRQRLLAHVSTNDKHYSVEKREYWTSSVIFISGVTRVGDTRGGS